MVLPNITVDASTNRIEIIGVDSFFRVFQGEFKLISTLKLLHVFSQHIGVVGIHRISFGSAAPRTVVPTLIFCLVTKTQ